MYERHVVNASAVESVTMFDTVVNDVMEDETGYCRLFSIDVVG